MKVERVKRKIKMYWRECRERKQKNGRLFRGSFYRDFYLSRVDFSQLRMVVESLNRGLTKTSPVSFSFPQRLGSS